MQPIVQEKWEGKVPRSKLPTKSFGIPDQRKFPLDSEKHVRSAIKLFGHASADKKKSLARRIRSAARKYNIDIPDTTQVYKYLHETGIDAIIPEGVKNVVFDFGSVLVDHDTRNTLADCNNIPEEYLDELHDYVHKFLFPENDTEYMKRDKMNLEDAKRLFNDMLPEHLKPYVDDVFDSFKDGIYNFDYTNRLIEALKQKGYKLYYLSNWFGFTYSLEKEYFNELTSHFDGGVFSWQTPYIKPQPEIYQYLIDKYHLNPSECIFFDDRAENLIPAKNLGFHVHQFDKKTTPIVLLDMTPLELKWRDMSNTLLINTPLGPEVVPISDIDRWLISAEGPEDIGTLPRVVLHTSLYLAISIYTQHGANLADGWDEFNVYIPNDTFLYDNLKSDKPTLVRVGRIYIDGNKDWYWTIQYPIEKNAEGYLVSGLSELTALNAINPMIGRGRHFLMSYGDPSWKQHMAYVNDYESDKGVVVNDDGVLETVYLGGMEPSAIYEYTGPESGISRLEAAYKNYSTVDNLYTLISGRKMLTEDQIEYDSDFKKVDIDSLYEHALSTIVTLNSQIIANECNTDHADMTFKTEIRTPFMEKYNACGDIGVYKDIDGFYFYSEMTHRRSESVKSDVDLTESMLVSIL